MTNMWDGTNYFLQDIWNFQPRFIFESYTFYPIWRQHFDPRVVLGWRYTRVSTVYVSLIVYVLVCSSIFAALNPFVESSVPMSRQVWYRLLWQQEWITATPFWQHFLVINRSTATGPECSRQTHHGHRNTRTHHSCALESALAPS